MKSRFIVKMGWFLTLPLIFTSIVAQAPQQDNKALAWENGLARTPPMGWNSWNKFGGSATETIVREIADAMVSSGMKDAGYQYIVLDDWWMANKRDANGNFVPDATKFPKSLKSKVLIIRLLRFAQ